MVHPIAASLASAEAAIDALAAQHPYVGRHMRVDALQWSAHSEHRNSARQGLNSYIGFCTE